MALLIAADLGLDPWDVFHQGIAGRSGLRFGLVVILVGGAVLLAWIPLRQRPGIGTLANVDRGRPRGRRRARRAARPPAPRCPRWPCWSAGIVLNGVATGLYVGAGLGPGPRDGLMTGLARARGRSIRVVRTSIEVAVLAVGWLLGGTIGVGTVLFAVAIGPLVHYFIPRFTVAAPRPALEIA